MTRNGEVISYLDSENLPYEITYYETADAQKQALADGEVDVVSSVSLSPIVNTRIVAQFAARPFYFAATKDNTALIEELDAAIRKIDQAEPQLQSRLYSSYFHSTLDAFELTQEQKDKLSGFGEIRVLCVDNDAPYAYQHSGEPTGMLIAILNDFALELSLDISFDFCASRDEAEALLGRQHYDILLGLPFTARFCGELGYIKSEPVIGSGIAFVRDISNSRRDSTAVVRGIESLVDLSIYQNVQYYDNVRDCLTAVERGKADLAVDDRSAVEYYIADSYSTLAASPIPGETKSICFAVSCDSDLALLEDLNYYLYSLSNFDKTVYLSEGSVHDSPSALSYFLHANPAQALALGMALTAVLAAVIFALLYARQMSKLEAKDVEFHEDSADLHDIAVSCAEIVEARATEGGLTLETGSPDEFHPPRVLVSERHLRQIFMNLIGNAIKYTHSGGTVRITAETLAQTEDSVTCRFSVSDTGIGMSKAFQSKMFEPFAQEQSDSLSEYRGTGLGLAIVKKIIDQMHGDISVDSAPGAGTSIVWTLKFRIDKDYHELPAAQEAEPLDLTGSKVLAAEDNELNAEILQMMLRQAGADVTLVENGELLVKAFEAAAPNTYDYFFTDIMMPVMDGYEACRRIRALDRPDTQSIPIIAMTANAFAEDVQRSLDAGMDAHISKPFDLKKLQQCLAKLSQKRV